MPFNFPNAPTIGQTYAPIAGVAYVWTGSQWDRMAPAVRTFDAGTVVAFAGINLPLGALWCDGSTFDKLAYPLLFTALGTNVLPDMRGRAAFGRDDMGGTAAGRLTNTGVGNPGINGSLLGASGGVDRRSLTTNELPTHAHTGTGTTSTESTYHTHTGLSGVENQSHAHWVAGGTDAQGVHAHGMTYGPTQLSTVSGTVQRVGGAAPGVHNSTTLDAGSHAHNIGITSGTQSANHNHYFTTDGNNVLHTHSMGFTTENAGNQQAFAIMPPAVVLNYIIYTGV